jgi:Mce-associated membrane protein
VHDPERPHLGDVTDPDEADPGSRVNPGAETLNSVAEAEDEVAQAEARAEAARARVARLRRTAQTAETTDANDDDRTVAHADEQPTAKSSRSRLRWLRRPRGKAVAVGAAIVLACASLGASGYIAWQHYTIVHNRRLAAEFAAAARQGVTTLMSMDAPHAREDIQRLIDACTGTLKTQLEAESSVMASKAEESKVSSKGTVEAVAVESVSDNSAVVLVAAKSDVTNADNTKRPPAVWRLSVNLDRDGGRLKMSKVDFLP